MWRVQYAVNCRSKRIVVQGCWGKIAGTRIFEKLFYGFFDRNTLRLFLYFRKETRGFDFACFELRRVPIPRMERFFEVFIADPSLHPNRTGTLSMLARIRFFRVSAFRLMTTIYREHERKVSCLGTREEQSISSIAKGHIFKALTIMPKAGFEPAHLAAPPPQDGVSANSTTSALESDYFFSGVVGVAGLLCCGDGGCGGCP